MFCFLAELQVVSLVAVTKLALSNKQSVRIHLETICEPFSISWRIISNTSLYFSTVAGKRSYISAGTELALIAFFADLLQPRWASSFVVF